VKRSGALSSVWGEGDNGRRAKKRSRTAERLREKKWHRGHVADEGFDVPPCGGDDFDLADLTGSLRKHKRENPLQDHTAIVSRETKKFDIPATHEEAQAQVEEATEARILNVQTEKKEAHVVAPRLEGESKRAFAKRMKKETKQIIRNAKINDNQNPDKKKRKKEFLNQKKNKKRKGLSEWSNENDDAVHQDDNDHDIDVFVTGERAAQKVAFGEQVERPPTFQLLPRGAKPKNKIPDNKKSKGLSDEQLRAEQRAMEKTRLQIQAQYAQIKAKRKRDGDFHL
jgi:hypothetical protein